jgi:trans-feruloyl-CoA hydratase/vanillin synthase
MLKKKYTCVKVDQQKDGITWVTFNRPEKRNAMSPTFHAEMIEILTLLETDKDTKLVILTGEGVSYSAGQDLKEYFRETEGKPEVKAKASADSKWRSEKLWMYGKPTISMVNGFCIGGAFTHCICADFSIAADDAIFSLSEVNWGILPGGMVSKMVTDLFNQRDAMFYACTGRTFTGKEAAKIGMVNYSVPKKNLRKETLKLAKELLEKNPNVLVATKHAIRATQNMSWRSAADYLNAKGAEIKIKDAARGHDAYAEGIKQFIDEKAYRPVFSPYVGAADGKTTAKGGKARASAARKGKAAPKRAAASSATKKTVRKAAPKKATAKKK